MVNTFRNGLIFKLIIGFVILVLMFVVLALNNRISTSVVSKQFSELTQVNTPFARASQQLANDLLYLENQIRIVAQTQSSSELNQLLPTLQQKSQQIVDSITNLNQRSVAGSDNRNSIDSIEQAFQRLMGMYDAMLQDKEKALQVDLLSLDVTQRLYEFSTQFQPMFDDLLFKLDSLAAEAALFETKAAVLNGLWLIEQMQTSKDTDYILRLGTRDLDAWKNDVVQVGAYLRKTESTPAVTEFVDKIFELVETVMQLVINNADPSASRGIPVGLGEIKIAALQLESQMQNHLLNISSEILSITGYLESLVDSSAQQASVIEQQLQQQIDVSTVVTAVLSLLAILLAIAIATYMTYQIKGGILRIKAILAKFAVGDFTHQFGAIKSDEMGDLERYSQSMAESLKHLIADIVDTLHKVEQSVNAGEQLSEQTQNNICKQKEKLLNVNDSVFEVHQVSDKVAEYAENTHQHIETAEAAALEGGKQVENNFESIASVNDYFQQTMQVILELDKGVHSIEDVLQTISSIAEQTNLLALNAAIEAARAGEQGRGFSVVADEVRGLANRTQQSTAQVQQLTDSMINSSKQAVKMMKNSHKRINHSLELATQANATITEFRDVMLHVKDYSTLIATSAEQQSATTKVVKGSVEYVTKLAQKTEHAAEQSAEAGSQLSQLCQQLNTKIKQFKLH